MTATVESVEVRRLEIPLARPWAPDVTTVTVLPVEVRCDDGTVGHGFSWTPTIGAGAVAAFLTEELAPWWTGRAADPALWQQAWERVHEAGGGGISTIALAGIDLALWDARARREGTSVTGVLGRRHDELPVYGSGVNLHYPLEELVAQVERWVAAGHRAVKVKVGKPDPAEDADRLAAVREVLGADRDLMIDANQRWDVDRAAHALELFTAVRPAWIEEPLRADDLAAHRELRRRTDLPIALGENLHTIHRFRDFLDAGVVDVVQPNVIRVGGITPFLAIADLARERGARLAAHLLPELSAQLSFALPEQTWIEDVEDARFADLGVLAESTGLEFGAGHVRGGPTRGLGIRFTDRPSLPPADRGRSGS
ncbi:L-alanine-DL-glutamate epimerase-like enolase superfamily enzyme [Diaminobutyricimonas aerilata]|uniref:L-alanine-DL-glutamate epimerase-like enolase superfamily enzyme n=1 Tax=Diaminobutyricimonas aerilata TaxID=1162967 RepID=A0A2M9CP40_9MICO|nr:mandelate racemase/muconate lactonizing enzyme family protein [Diaminobutyricimonas aerilata]PJJ73659.1 L-alanine-DL-glutamate epimerase-like enolase superfamily enzyme [Diaminobutyricimonas aerilata]